MYMLAILPLLMAAASAGYPGPALPYAAPAYGHGYAAPLATSYTSSYKIPVAAAPVVKSYAHPGYVGGYGFNPGYGVGYSHGLGGYGVGYGGGLGYGGGYSHGIRGYEAGLGHGLGYEGGYSHGLGLGHGLGYGGGYGTGLGYSHRLGY